MKSYPALQVATVDWAPSILRCVLLEHIQMAVNCRKLRIVLTADQDITAMMKDLLLPRHSVMQGIIVPRVRMSAVHSPVLLESTVLKEVRNLSIVLQGHLLRAHNHLCVLSVLKASIVCRDLLFQVILVLLNMTVLRASTALTAQVPTGRSVLLVLTATKRT